MTATALLLLSMLVLLATSVLISNALSPLLSAFGGFAIRQIHILAGYWAVMLVSVHLGLRWPILMGAARALCGITRTSALRTSALRAGAAVVAACGLWSASVHALGTKLTMQMTLDWWNFEVTVAGFFFHWLAIAGLTMALTYYARLGLRALTRAGASRPPVAQDVQQ